MTVTFGMLTHLNLYDPLKTSGSTISSEILAFQFHTVEGWCVCIIITDSSAFQVLYLSSGPLVKLQQETRVIKGSEARYFFPWFPLCEIFLICILQEKVIAAVKEADSTKFSLLGKSLLFGLALLG